jgi:hypothetical protein
VVCWGDPYGGVKDFSVLYSVSPAEVDVKVCESIKYNFALIRFNSLQKKANLKNKMSASVCFDSLKIFVRVPVPVHICVRVHVHDHDLAYVCLLAPARFHVLRGHGHVAWIQTYSVDTHMQHEHGHTVWMRTIGHAAWTWTCSMDMGIQQWHGHAAWTWTCSTDMGMQHGHGHAALTQTWTYSMNMDMQHENRHEHVVLKWTWTCGVDMDIRHGHGNAGMPMPALVSPIPMPNYVSNGVTVTLSTTANSYLGHFLEVHQTDCSLMWKTSRWDQSFFPVSQPALDPLQNVVADPMRLLSSLLLGDRSKRCGEVQKPCRTPNPCRQTLWSAMLSLPSKIILIRWVNLNQLRIRVNAFFY